MKQKIVLTVVLMSILLTGCNSKEESTYLNEGKIALENHQYEESKKLFSSAIEENSADENARAMYMQSVRMINVGKYENIKDYEKAIRELQMIEEIKGGSSVIKGVASTRKNELEKLHKELQTDEQERKDEARYVAKKDKYRLQEEALEIERRQQEAIQKKQQEKEEQEEREEQEEQNKVEDKEETDKVESENIVVTPPDKDATLSQE